MASNINATVPAIGADLSSTPIRNNFIAAKAEIEALQNSLGNNGATTAASVTFTPSGNILSTNVQSAIEELDTEKPQLVAVPITPSSAGIPGQIAYETGFLYICIETNTWQRATLASW
jgi:hypothetical protein